MTRLAKSISTGVGAWLIGLAIAEGTLKQMSLAFGIICIVAVFRRDEKEPQ